MSLASARVRSPVRSLTMSPVPATSDDGSPIGSILLTDRSFRIGAKENLRPPMSPGASLNSSPKLSARGGRFKFNSVGATRERPLSGSSTTATTAERHDFLSNAGSDLPGPLTEKAEFTLMRSLSAPSVEHRGEPSTALPGCLFQRAERGSTGSASEKTESNSPVKRLRERQLNGGLLEHHAEPAALVPGALFEKIDTARSRSYGSRAVSDSSGGLATPRLSDEAISQLADRQKEWDRAAANADQKQAELAYYQWNLIREQMNTFSKEILSLRSEVKAMRPTASKVTECETELKKQNESMITLDRALSLQKESMNTLSLSLQKNVEEKLSLSISDVSNSLRGALEEETKHRQSDMRDLSRQISQAKELFEKEIRDRQSSVSHQRMIDELRQQHHEVQTSLRHEKSDREKTSADLQAQLSDLKAQLSDSQTQLASCQKDLQVEHAQRTDQESRLAQNLQNLEGHLAPAVKEVRLMVQQEINEIRSELSVAMQTLSGLQNEVASGLDAANMKSTRLGDELHTSCRDLSSKLDDMRHSLDQEVRIRSDETSQASHAAQRLQGQLDHEGRARAQAMEELCDQTSLHLREIRHKVEKEAGDYLATGERLERLCNELKFHLEAEVTRRNRSSDEADARFRELAQRCTEDARAWAEEHAKISIDLASCRAQVDGESKVLTEVSERLRLLTDTVDSEIKERTHDFNELKESWCALRHALDQDLRRLEARLQAEFENEVRARKEGDDQLLLKTTAFSDSLEATAETVEITVGHVRQAVEKESRDRRVADEALENLVAKHAKDLHAGLEKEASDRGVHVDQLERAHAALSTQVKAEADERMQVKAEAGRNLNSAMQRLETALQTVRDSIRKETLERTANHEDLGRSASALKIELEAEARARKEGDAEIAQRMHEQSTALEYERTERDRADASLRNQVAACQHDLASERSSRVDEVSSLRSLLQAEASERSTADEVGAKNLRTTTRRLENTIESACDLLWAKMGTMAERLVTFGREWRETSPTAELMQHMHTGSLSLQDARDSL
mmetsp:Transcript_149523/g.272204  ORF Transcript_149523/g.272204 Transcript_149523/m.272204 type:complete len:1033 (+) Transcript_149523:103-3201(+)